MTWFAAHIVMVVHLKGQKQSRFPVWENVILLSAKSEEEAFVKAEHHGRTDEGDDDGSFRWGGKPATWVFAGVRKLTECVSPEYRPDDGTEITFNELEFGSTKEVAAFAAGRAVDVRYNDRYRPPKESKPAAAPKRAKRKPA
jgi:hypothetical protein